MYINITKSEAKHFLEVLEKMFEYNKKSNKDLSMYVEDFEKRGVPSEVLYELKRFHFIQIHTDRPIWIAWNNPLYPNMTIRTLKDYVDDCSDFKIEWKPE